MVKKLSNFSVIIRTRNEEQWIGHAIQSVLDQLYKPDLKPEMEIKFEECLEWLNR